MKTILSTLVALGVLTGAANAQPFKPFDDITIAVPHSTGYEQALPRSSNDDYRDALPLTHETFGDITIATP